MMGRREIPVDLRNPGQVFACLGFLEAAHILCGPAEGGFAWDSGERFLLEAEGAEDPVGVVIDFLRSARVEWLSHCSSMTERDGGETVVRHNIASSNEPKAADLPGRLIGEYQGGVYVIPIGYWADGSSRFRTSFKKSTNGASSHVRLSNALQALRAFDPLMARANPFQQWANTRSLFRWDPRGSVDPIESGTSPDKLRKGGIEIRVATYPICELLAIVGLEYARPRKNSTDVFQYYVWGRGLKSQLNSASILLPPELARAAVTGCFAYLDKRKFMVTHSEVKKGGDRNMDEILEVLDHARRYE